MKKKISPKSEQLDEVNFTIHILKITKIPVVYEKPKTKRIAKKTINWDQKTHSIGHYLYLTIQHF